MKWKTSKAGPATRIRPVITSLGGVRAVMTNPVAWGLDPCLGICPFPHRYDSEPVEGKSGPPKPLWSAGGPGAAFTSGAKGSITSGGGAVAPAAAPVVTSTNSGAATPTTTTTAPTCPEGQIAVDLGNRIVCRVPWG